MTEEEMADLTVAALPGTLLYHTCRRVARLKQGQCIAFKMDALRDIGRYHHNGATFEPWHRVLENIMGSAYTHSLDVRYEKQEVIFCRHADTGKRRYFSPDIPKGTN